MTCEVENRYLSLRKSRVTASRSRAASHRSGWEVYRTSEGKVKPPGQYFFFSGGQFELSSYLLSRGLELLGRINLTELSEDEAKDVAELKASLYIQLAKSECCQADEDGAVDARKEILADAVKNCTKALGIK